MQKRLFLCGALMVVSACSVRAGMQDLPIDSCPAGSCPDDHCGPVEYVPISQMCLTDASCCRGESCTTNSQGSAGVEKDAPTIGLVGGYGTSAVRVVVDADGHCGEFSADDLTQIVRTPSAFEKVLCAAISDMDRNRVCNACQDIRRNHERVAFLPMLKHFETVLDRALFRNSCVTGLSVVAAASVLGGLAYWLRSQDIGNMKGTAALGYSLAGLIGCGSCALHAGFNSGAVGPTGRYWLKRKMYAVLDTFLQMAHTTLIVGGDEREIKCVLERIAQKLAR